VVSHDHRDHVGGDAVTGLRAKIRATWRRDDVQVFWWNFFPGFLLGFLLMELVICAVRHR
jgi:hypothetical protein